MAAAPARAQTLKLNPNPLAFTFFSAGDPPQSGTITVSGAASFQVRLPVPTPSWLAVSTAGTVVTVQVTSPPVKGEYYANLTLQFATSSRIIPVTVRVFPTVTISLSAGAISFPNNNSYGAQTVTATTFDSGGNQAAQIQAKATPDPGNPDRIAVTVNPASVSKTNTNSSDFSISVNPSLLSPGDHSVAVIFENQLNREQVFLNVAIVGTAPPQPANPVISGTVLDDSGLPVNGVTVSFSGASSGVTNGSGTYSVTVSPGYTGTATPSARGYTFVPASRSYSNVTSNRGGENYTASRQTGVTVEGNVTTSDGRPILGAVIDFGGGIRAFSDAAGHYVAPVGAGYSGTATISLENFTFFPASYTIPSLSTSVTGYNFVGTRVSHTLSGYVRTAQGQAVAGVRLDFANGPAAVTDSNGFYVVHVPVGYSGLVTLTLAGYSFSPPGRNYNTLTTDLITENYTAAQSAGTIRISGAVRDSQGAGVPGAVIAFSGGTSARTDASGAYAVTLDSGYTGTATPSLPGYVFTPPSRAFSNQTADLGSQDFTATALSTNTVVSGTVRDQRGNPLANVALAFTGGVTVFTGTDGTYLATLPPGYSGVVTVSHPGYLLTPAARSYSQLPPVLSGEDYSAQFQPGAPEIVSPLPGSTFGSGTVTFQWMINPCSTQYFLALGSTPAGSDLFNDDAGTAGTLTVNGLPADGRTIYARFFSRIGGEFRYNDYVFTAADASQPPAPAQLLSPAPGPLDQGSITFRWSPGRGVSQYYLAIGKQLGGNDLANLDQGTAQSATVSGLPGDGSRIYVRLQSRIGQEWQSSDYVYTLPSGPETGKAEMVSPPGMVALCSTSATFQWSAGRNVSQYFMAIGSGPAGNDLFNIDLGTSLSRTIDGLPADGRTLYVRLFSLIGSTWFFNDYLYAAAAR